MNNQPSEAEIREEIKSDLHRLCESCNLPPKRSTPLDSPKRLLQELGWSGVSIPRKFGGRGLGAVGRHIAIEETARVNSSLGASLSAASLGAGLLLEFGNHRQQETWLPRLAAGDDIMTICMTEPDSGSHLLGMNTQAISDPGGWRVSGRKCYIGNSHIATVHGVIATVAPAAGSRSLGAFIVPADAEGCSVGAEHNLEGLRGFSLGEVVFDNCHVPSSARVGGHGDGLAFAHAVVTRHGKLNIGSVALGIAQASLDLAVKHSGERRLYGAPLHRVEAVQRRLADMYLAVAASRVTLLDAARKLDAGMAADSSLLMGKLLASDAARDCATAAVELMGARGSHASEGAMQLVSDALMTQAPSGTADVQRKRLAQIALGNYQPAKSGNIGGLAHVG